MTDKENKENQQSDEDLNDQIDEIDQYHLMPFSIAYTLIACKLLDEMSNYLSAFIWNTWTNDVNN